MRFRVQFDPGVQVPGVGFFRSGEEFTAPESYLPSRKLIPLDKEALAALRKAAEGYVVDTEAKRARAGLPKLTPGEREDLLKVEGIPGGEKAEQKAEPQKQAAPQGRAADR